MKTTFEHKHSDYRSSDWPAGKVVDVSKRRRRSRTYPGMRLATDPTMIGFLNYVANMDLTEEDK